MNAEVMLDSWAGRTNREVKIVGETKTRYKVQAVENMRLPHKTLNAGETAYVPKYAVKRVGEK